MLKTISYFTDYYAPFVPQIASIKQLVFKGVISFMVKWNVKVTYCR
jgi:hypothetical protein